ncbi:MAG: endonuclease/exonuclease/phosphatase family protein [Pseudomonadota bacterium]
MQGRVGSVLLVLAAVSGSPAQADEPLPGEEGVILRVLTYNINALPAPLKRGKAPLLQNIAEILRARRAAGNQPQVVVLQEAFTENAEIIREVGGYRYAVKGPDAEGGGPVPVMEPGESDAAPHTPLGTAPKLVGSGLYLLSDFPILAARAQSFGNAACAGFDCFSNKAILWGQLKVPGLAAPLDIITTHMNSHKSAGVPAPISLKAHAAQTDMLAHFLEQEVGNERPLIMAGDFNTRYAPRLAYFRARVTLADSAEQCLAMAWSCRLGANSKSGEMLYDTNDKQYFRAGAKVHMRPVFSTRNFQERVDGRPLSDHSGYEVHYALGQAPPALAASAGPVRGAPLPFQLSP